MAAGEARCTLAFWPSFAAGERRGSPHAPCAPDRARVVRQRVPDPALAPRAARLDIDPKEFTVSRDVEVIDDFAAMGLKEDLLRGIYAYGVCLARPAAAPRPAPRR